MPLTDKGEERRFPKGGVAYRIPGTAEISIIYDGKELDKKTLHIPQLGVVFGMEPSMFSDKKTPGYAHFDPLTGAIKETGIASVNRCPQTTVSQRLLYEYTHISQSKKLIYAQIFQEKPQRGCTASYIYRYTVT